MTPETKSKNFIETLGAALILFLSIFSVIIALAYRLETRLSMLEGSVQNLTSTLSKIDKQLNEQYQKKIDVDIAKQIISDHETRITKLEDNP